MSHHQTGDHRRPGRRPTILLLTPVLAGSLVLTAVGPVQAAAPDRGTTDGTTSGAQDGPVADSGADAQRYSAGTYVVRLADDPVASYTGGTDGLKSTKPPQGKRLDTGTRAVRDYREHLGERRADVLADVRGVKPLYTYDIVANGFAAELTAAQANRLARTPGVVSLTRNETVPLARAAEADAAAGVPAGTAADTATGTAADRATGTLPVPDTAAFLGLKGEKGLYSKFPGGQRHAGEGVIIGVLDTGIDTGNPSLRALAEPRPDADVIAKKWKGECDPGEDTAHQVRCNNKVIGARYFDEGLTDPGERDWASPMDSDSHGTHTATTAAGNTDVETSVPDSGISGRISGLAPAARIAAYKVCWSVGCTYVDMVAAVEAAVADGVDVINMSLGGAPAHLNEPFELALLNAAKAGVFVSASAANTGPGTVANTTPWVTTVAASTHDTGFRTTATLGDGTSYTGVGVSASALPSAPLVDAAKAARSGVAAADAERCMPGTLDPDKVKGAIVVCKRGGNLRVDKSEQVEQAGGVGMVLYIADPASDALTVDAMRVPSVYVSNADGQAVKAYAERAGSGATVRLSAAETVHQRAPEVMGFSASGPDPISGGDLLKPDITVPGADIVAGTAKGSPTFKGEQGVMSGTSMSAPHLAGLALLLRALHPDWSPAEVKSALMTTATTTTQDGKPIQRSGADATPLDYGAGHAVPTSAADPGLVYDATSADWTSFICAVEGQLVDDSGEDTCATVARTDPSDLNYPTIAVGDLVGAQTITRTVTNVSGTTGVYTAKTKAPRGFKAEVSPRRLVVAPGASATYKVTFTRTDAAFGDWSYGSVTWTDTGARHTVRSAVALRPQRFVNPAPEATGTGPADSVTLSPRVGWNGTFTTRVDGLYAGETKTGTLTGTNQDFVDPADVPAELPPATVRTEITVPEGTGFARVGILSADHLTGSDLDLWVVDKDSGELVSAPAAASDEHADLAPGTYVVHLNQWALPEGATSQTYTLHTWLIGDGDGAEPDRPAAVDPASQQVTAGDAPKAAVAWKDLSPEESTAYLGLVEYGDGTTTVGRTVLTVTVAP